MAPVLGLGTRSCLGQHIDRKGVLVIDEAEQHPSGFKRCRSFRLAADRVDYGRGDPNLRRLHDLRTAHGSQRGCGSSAWLVHTGGA